MFPTIRLQSSSPTNADFEITFKDVNAQFAVQQSEFVYEEDAAIQAFLILLSTPKGSRWWRPEYGTRRLLELLFEPFDDQTAEQLASVIQMTSDSNANGYSGVVINKVDIQMDYGSSTYVVNLNIDIPALRVKGKAVSFGLRNLGN